MPIRINLLAEQQALELERQRDPAKRALWIGGALVSMSMIWVFSLQLQILRANSAVKHGLSELKVVEKKSHEAASSLKRSAELGQKLAALKAVATNRFLWGNTLNALQHTVVPDIQIVRLRGEQLFSMIDQRPTVGTDGKLKTKPPIASERITLIIEAKDFAPASDLNHNKLISEIAASKTMKEALSRNDGVSLKDRLPAQPDPVDPGRNYIPFSIECRYPEKLRVL